MRAPDLKAPRFRYKHRDTIDLDLIKSFKKKYPQYSSYEDSVLMNAIKTHNRIICKEVIDNRDGIELQSDLGNIFIGMAPACRNNIAWDKSIQLGIKVCHRNHETDGKVAKIVYTNYGNRYKLENRQLWQFIGVRQFRREVAARTPVEWKKYVTLDNHYRIWELFDKRLYKGRAQNKLKKTLEVYNEFEI